MIDWGDEAKPRPHTGRVGLDRTLKDARRGDLSAVRRHLKADPTLLSAKSGGHNRTFLWEAVRGGHPDVVRFLLRAGADPNAPGRVRAETVVLVAPHALARRRGRLDLAAALLRAGAVPDIFSACLLGDADRVDALLAADPAALAREQADDSVWRVTPLHHAVAGGHAGVVRSLLARGAPVARYSRLLCNAAARMGHAELIPVLIEAGADCDLARAWGRPTV